MSRDKKKPQPQVVSGPQCENCGNMAWIVRAGYLSCQMCSMCVPKLMTETPQPKKDRSPTEVQ